MQGLCASSNTKLSTRGLTNQSHPQLTCGCELCPRHFFKSRIISLYATTMAGRADNIIDSLTDLEKAAITPANQRKIKITSTLEQVCANAYQNGLQHAYLERLINIITLPNTLNQGEIGNLIKNLYPTSKIADAVVIKVVASLGHGREKPSYSTQAALLKWLIMVYDALENNLVLSRLYGVLFNLLDTVAIKPQLCHILSLITRRKHVRPFRIQALMELTRQAGNEPPLVGLMRVFKDYYPDVIVGETTQGRASVFKHPDLEWKERLGQIQKAYRESNQDGQLPEQKPFRVTRRRGDMASLIPPVQTSNAQEASTTLEEIHDVSQFVRKLEKIELPNQLVSVIGDPLLQKFLQLKSSESTLRRIDNWLLAFFEDQLQSQGSDGIILEMLSAVRDYTWYTKVLPPACLAYLQSMVHSWNGIIGREVILDLISYTPMSSFQDLYQTTFQALEEAVLEDETLEAKLALLNFYRSLLLQWYAALLARSPPPSEEDPSISDLITHAGNLALTIIQCSTSISTHSTILNFYEAAVAIFSQPSLKTAVKITTPPPELVYTLYFTCSLSNISRLCAILATYKRAFELAMALKVNPTDLEPKTYPKDHVNHFNGFLMDTCNCIWRGRAFNRSDPNATGCLLPESTTTSLANYVAKLDTGISLPSIFTLSYSPVLCHFAISYLREIEDREEDSIDIRHAGPVTQASLKQLERDGGLNISWADYRLGVLRYLETKSATGVGELMYNTMKHLMTAREKMV
ncbi:Mis6 domain-containing protein [Bisporella sp. PMI_857]|nr:Mis6 domain-containing protein [Bisporella sp. PMI_857]